ncbi:MAG: NBR1-Ig-like domain-containing protein [Chloroflexota bacterium]|nr:NBR1-Ig-like domain-containing protein [Chloroflexota bacterium]
MKKHKLLIVISIIIGVIVMGALSACKGSSQAEPTVNPELKVTSAVQTVYAQMTEAATQVPPTPTSTNTVEPTPTPTMEPTETPTNTTAPAEDGAATTEATPKPQPTSASDGMPRYRANLEQETIPDGTEFYPGQSFTKMWRLKNIGTSTWTKDFYFRFVDGDLLGAPSVIHLTESVPTWGYVNFEVEMTAPIETGHYKGYWMITSDDGKIFGIGSEGSVWFWVDIEVVEEK